MNQEKYKPYTFEALGFCRPEKTISTPYPFIAIGDLSEVVGRIDPTFLTDQMIKQFQNSLLCLQKEYAPVNSTFYYIDQSAMTRQIETEVRKDCQTGKKMGTINFDRYIFQSNTPENVFQMNVSRSPDGNLTTRPGSESSKEQQFERLANWLEQGQFEQIILVDDVVAFATTFPPIISLIRQTSPKTEISVLCGVCSSQGEWAGKEKLEELGVTVSALTLAQASPKIEGGSLGMAIPDSRDSTIFGGKIGWTADGSRSLSFPYFYPFSEPTSSLMTPEKNRQSSIRWLGYNKELIKYLEQKLGTKLTIGDLESAGFGVPYTSIQSVQERIDIPDKDMFITTYLAEIGNL